MSCLLRVDQRKKNRYREDNLCRCQMLKYVRENIHQYQYLLYNTYYIAVIELSGDHRDLFHVMTKNGIPMLIPYDVLLTRWGRVTHIWVSKLVIRLVSSHYLNQCWSIITWTFGNQFLWNVNFHAGKYIWKCRLENGGHFASPLRYYCLSNQYHKLT